MILEVSADKSPLLFYVLIRTVQHAVIAVQSKKIQRLGNGFHIAGKEKYTSKGNRIPVINRFLFYKGVNSHPGTAEFAC